ncbi:MAG TPA: DUF1549 domain-containing protein [Pirellulales bacterium]|jgi:hypothetical protein|nr:DUF1549 domain-containing protein [Pirellulales bacterium]
MKRIILASFLIGGLSLPADAAEVLRPANQRFASTATAEVPDLQRHVLPLMGRLGCNGRACHGSFQGQGGFRLSLFGYDFKMDHEALTAGEHPRVDPKKPVESLILAKPTGTDDDHGGGHRLDVGSWQYRILLRWIEAGAAPVDEATSAKFDRLEVTPREIVFAKTGEKAQLKAICHWSDGTAEDVTPLCRFQTSDEAVAKVDATGRITVVGKGDTHIVAFYDNGVVPVSVMLPVSDKNGENYPTVPTPTKVDELVVAKLRKLGVVPAEVCSDSEFLRRASLDITGTLPTAEEVETFLADKSPKKRVRKIDELLERPAYAAWWATKFCDTWGNAESQLKNIGPRDTLVPEQWYNWVERRVAENMHYDDLVEGVVLATGRSSPDQSFDEYCTEMRSYFCSKPTADYADRETMPWYWMRRNMKKSNEKALSFSYAFLGVRLQCAECHKHPFDQWSQYDFQHFTAFFDRVTTGYPEKDREKMRAMMVSLKLDGKKIGQKAKDDILRAAVDKGMNVPFDEVYIARSERTREKDKSKNDKGKRVDASRVITPKVLGGDELVDASYDDPRQPLMDWLRQKDNPYFARALVNRVWAHYFNVGIVEPPDDMNLANAPSNAALLGWLADEFIAHDYDLKWLHRTITTSRTYQLSWKTNATNEFDLRNFSHAVPRRLPAEVVLDAVMTATAGADELAKRSNDPAELCAIGMSKGYTRRGAGGNYALSVFGKPKRETPCDCERSNEPSLLQTVYLRNDEEMFDLIERNDGWLKHATKGMKRPNDSALKARDDRIDQLASRVKQTDEKFDKNKDNRHRAKLDDERRRIKSELAKLEAERKSEADAQAAATTKAADLVRQAYLRTFSRQPSEKELARADEYLAQSPDLASGLRDLLWALMNSKEFVVNH